MSSKLKNLSDFSHVEDIPHAGKMRIGIVVSEWNTEITSALLAGATSTLLKYGCLEKNLHIVKVPGSYELVVGAQLLGLDKDIDGVICLGCVIQGETKHFDFICQAVANGLIHLSLDIKKPVVFGVLTTNNMTQALARSGGKHGNKGDEAALTAIKMVALLKPHRLKHKKNKNSPN